MLNVLGQQYDWFSRSMMYTVGFNTLLLFRKCNRSRCYTVASSLLGSYRSCNARQLTLVTRRPVVKNIRADKRPGRPDF